MGSGNMPFGMMVERLLESRTLISENLKGLTAKMSHP